MFQNHMVTCKIFTLESVKVFIQNYYQKWCLKDQNLLFIKPACRYIADFCQCCIVNPDFGYSDIICTIDSGAKTKTEYLHLS